MPTRQFEGDDLDALHRRIRDELGTTATIVRAGRVRRGGVAGFFTREGYRVEVELPAPGPSRTAMAPGADIVARGAGTAAPGASSAPGEPEEPAAGTAVDLQAARVADVVHIDFADHLRRAEETRVGEASTDLVASPALPRPQETPRQWRPRVGDVTPGPAGTEPTELPGLPDDPTGVVLVAGEAPEVDVEARLVAAAMGLGDDGVLRLPCPAPAPGGEQVGPGRRARGAPDPATLRVLTRVLRRRLQGRRCVLVAELPRWGSSTEALRRVATAVRVDYLLAVVPASTKPEDLGAWSRELGGVSALSVVGAACSPNPASALSSGVPVARLDGLPATQERWHAVLGTPSRA